MGETEEKQNPKLPPGKVRYRPLVSGLWAKDIEKNVDRRTKIGRMIAKLREELIEHVGGNPSITELILIDRICSKVVRCRLHESNILSGEHMGSRDYFLALENGLRHDLKALGLKPKGRPIKGLSEYLLERQKTKGDEA